MCTGQGYPWCVQDKAILVVYRTGLSLVCSFLCTGQGYPSGVQDKAILGVYWTRLSLLCTGHMELFMQGQDKAILEENDAVEAVEGEECGLIGTAPFFSFQKMFCLKVLAL